MMMIDDDNIDGLVDNFNDNNIVIKIMTIIVIMDDKMTTMTNN